MLRDNQVIVRMVELVNYDKQLVEFQAGRNLHTIYFRSGRVGDPERTFDTVIIDDVPIRLTWTLKLGGMGNVGASPQFAPNCLSDGRFYQRTALQSDDESLDTTCRDYGLLERMHKFEAATPDQFHHYEAGWEASCEYYKELLLGAQKLTHELEQWKSACQANRADFDQILAEKMAEIAQLTNQLNMAGKP